MFASIGIDIGKEIFHVVAFDTAGRIVLRRKIRRLALEREFAKLPQRPAGAQAADHPGDLREAVRQGAEKRLQRRRGHR